MKFVKRFGLFIIVLATTTLTVGGLAYLAGAMGESTPRTEISLLPTLTLAPVSLSNVRLAPLEPDVIDYLIRTYGTIPMDDLSGIPPVGAYFPQAGNTSFQLDATPTPRPYPTSPPIPPTFIPTAVQRLLPTSADTGLIALPTSAPTSVPTSTESFLFLAQTAVAFVPPTAAPAEDFGPLVQTAVAAAPGIPPNLAENTGNCAPSGYPVPGILTQPFWGIHSGVDLAAPLNTPVYATQSGVVTWADWNTFGYGNLVIIQSGHYITYYAHNTSFNVTAGQVVSKGALIAWSGSTGHSSGPHVHYETRIDDVPVNPQTFDARGLATC
jgi:murein DD-endopeptidase MepM/ murein hydrolase activator NlpD